MSMRMFGDWGQVLAREGLADFDSLWRYESRVTDAANVGRGGWSEVIRLPLRQAVAGVRAVFVKRQENYVIRTRRRPLRGELTVENEARSVRTFAECGLGVADLCALGTRRAGGRRQGILVTAELSEHCSLEQLLSTHRGSDRATIIRHVARSVRAMHDAGLRHNALYAKHVFLRRTGPRSWDVRFIDLEKVRRSSRRRATAVRDLGTLFRRTKDVQHGDIARFAKEYFSPPDDLGREGVCRAVDRRARRRRRARNAHARFARIAT